jgi:hypothetical protein
MPDLTPLSPPEQEALGHYESIIARGLETFISVGSALLAIRDDRLYRATHPTFEQYCADRWGLARRRAYQLIDAAAVVATVNHGTHPLPANERQARPLTALPPDLQPLAWQRVLETVPDGHITAAHVQQIVDELSTSPPPTPYNYHPTPTSALAYAMRFGEWLSPPVILTRVVQLFTTIDLDPASNSHTTPHVPARTHYTKEDDGLMQPWFGRVYLNPPYSGETPVWVDRLCYHWHRRHIREALALLPVRTDAQWFSRLRPFPRCFIWGRLSFSQSRFTAPFPSMVVYVGYRPRAFTRVFRDIGDIYTCLSNARTQKIPPRRDMI